jgi:hypothetical protein
MPQRDGLFRFSLVHQVTAANGSRDLRFVIAYPAEAIKATVN